MATCRVAVCNKQLGSYNLAYICEHHEVIYLPLYWHSHATRGEVITIIDIVYTNIQKAISDNETSNIPI